MRRMTVRLWKTPAILYSAVQILTIMKAAAQDVYKRQPLQVVTQRQDDFLAFINEKFVFSRLAAFLVGNRKDQVLSLIHI